MSLQIPSNQTVEQYLRSCSEQERMRIFKQAHYDSQMFCVNIKHDRQAKEIDRVMKNMGYKF